MNDILDLTDQVASTALFGSIGVGKSSVALSLLHHNRTEVKFGRNRHFMRCGDLTNSLDVFLERLSEAIGINRTTEIDQLRSHLESSPPLILLLDGVDSILDPLAPEAEDIFATIEEFGCYQHVCLLTTSRMYPEISGFHRLEVPTLSGSDARDAFYGLCHLGRSAVIDDLIARLDFHPLSIDLLARSVRENNWDESALLKVWDGGRAGGPETRYRQGLRDAVELSFRSPTIKNLGTAAREVLKAIAAFPSGVEECTLKSTFPDVVGIEVAVDALCKFSLLYRQDGFVKMLSPFRFYFLDSALGPTQQGIICKDTGKCNPAKACMFFPLRPLCLCYTCMLTLSEGLPIYTRGPNLPPAASRRGTPLARVNWIKRFLAMRKSKHSGSDSSVVDLIDHHIELLALFSRSGLAPTNPDTIRQDPVNTPSTADVRQSLPAVVPYEVQA